MAKPQRTVQRVRFSAAMVVIAVPRYGCDAGLFPSGFPAKTRSLNAACHQQPPQLWLTTLLLTAKDCHKPPLREDVSRLTDSSHPASST